MTMHVSSGRNWPALRNLGLAAIVALGGFAMFQTANKAAEEAVVIPAPAQDLPAADGLQTAVFAGGCFWGVQGVFQHLDGVTNAVSGYAGGTSETATYDQVSTGGTHHAEAVEVTYDPKLVSYGELLQVYFSVAHNPTQLNFQGPDHGTQYRSAIFFATPEQEKVAKDYIAQLDAAKVYPAPIVTTLEPLQAFYAAEAYHQDFLTNNPAYPYIVFNDLPKIEALKKLFPAEFRDKPVLVADAR
ncbi:MAG TPA: peptide-methionine (S)-S-oxide reductase MsrA [Devosia sp.]|nr:peptide-methionine (S)-S-oxide reductase MsrA [Devosia sp.]